MSIETATTCATAQRSCRSRGKFKRRNVKRDLTCQTEIIELKTPEIHIEEDLGLETLQVCTIPQDMLFPGEYNVYLQDKIKSMSEENKQLAEILKERDKELASLKDELLKYESQSTDKGLKQTSPFLGPHLIQHADMAACRVMELSKQVCELTASLEEQRSRCCLAENKLLCLISSEEQKQPLSTECLTKRDAEVKALSDKLNATNSKLFECRNKIQHLQQELKNSQKVLVWEVGDGVSIPDLIANGGTPSGWRGRAQQIQVLQQRVMELNDRLKKCSDNRNLECSPNSCGESKCISKDKKAVEMAQQDMRTAQLQLQESIRKLDAAKARIKVLESEICSCKVRIQHLTDKSTRDDDLIHMLQNQVSHLEENFQMCKDEARSELRKSEKYYQVLLDDQRMEKQRNMHLLSRLEDKEKQIKRLENMVFDLKDKEIFALKRDANGGEPAESVEKPPVIEGSVTVDEQDKDSKKVPSAEIECKKLLEIVGTTNRRLNDARHECDKHKSALRLERQRLARLEAKLTRLELERSGSFSLTRRQSATRKGDSVTPSEANGTPKEELQNKLELFQEEILTLRTRLACLEQEKEDDLRAFSSLLAGPAQHTLLKRNQTSFCLPVIESSKAKP